MQINQESSSRSEMKQRNKKESKSILEVDSYAAIKKECLQKV